MMTITAHARKRFKERFRLQFNPEIFKDGRDIIMLRKLFEESKPVDFALRMVPGLYNAVCIKHGRTVRISKTRNIIFIHSELTKLKVLYTVLQEGSYIAGRKF